MTILPLFPALVMGLILGLLFYGGLWVTIRLMIAAPHPAALTLGSFMLRTGITAAGFLVVTDGRWQNALACLIGFIAGRIAVWRLVGTCT